MVFGKNSPLKGERVQRLLTHGAASKHKLWLAAIRVVAGHVPFPPKPKVMERLMFSFHKTINVAYSIAAYFTRDSPIFPGNIKMQYTLALHSNAGSSLQGSLCTFKDYNFSCIS